jgi:hypothetical protein
MKKVLHFLGNYSCLNWYFLIIHFFEKSQNIKIIIFYNKNKGPAWFS